MVRTTAGPTYRPAELARPRAAAYRTSRHKVRGTVMLRITTGKGDRNRSLVELLIRWPRPLKQAVSVAAIGTSRLGGIFGGPLPGPATLDLGFEGKTEKGSNRH